jgi:hypothetical protein
MLTRTELVQLMDRLERNMPHNADVRVLCADIRERMAAKGPEPIEQAKPWLAEGMSRATWYRRRRASARSGESVSPGTLGS